MSTFLTDIIGNDPLDSEDTGDDTVALNVDVEELSKRTTDSILMRTYQLIVANLDDIFDVVAARGTLRVHVADAQEREISRRVLEVLNAARAQIINDIAERHTERILSQRRSSGGAVIVDPQPLMDELVSVLRRTLSQQRRLNRQQPMPAA